MIGHDENVRCRSCVMSIERSEHAREIIVARFYRGDRFRRAGCGFVFGIVGLA